MKGYIYKLTDGTLTYYGSTIMNMNSRMAHHKSKINKCRTNQMNMDLIEITILEELECENKNELFKQQLQERKKGRESTYKFFVEVLGWIFYILYLPLKPWIWIVTESSKKLQNLYSGMIVPL